MALAVDLLARVTLAACLAASLAACGGAVAPRPVPAPAPAPAAEATARPAPEEWRTYVPERCRDDDGDPVENCRGRVVTTSTSMEIFDAISFIDNTAQLAPQSHRMIEAVAQSLIANPSIQVVEVRGHSDSLLHPEDRADLARKRAEVVAAELVAQGVNPVRLTTYGASDSELLYPADDARNRRVEFVILARDE